MSGILVRGGRAALAAVAACSLGLLAAPVAEAGAPVAAGHTAGHASARASDPASVKASDPVGGPLLKGGRVVVDLPAGVPRPPKITAKAYVVADADTGEVLATKAPHKRLRPASTLKTLTALTLQPKLAPQTVYTASADDANIEGSKAGMVPGGTYTVEQMFQALFLASGNDAAHGLATLNGGVAQTVAEMNALADHLQALDTHAVSPEGLDEDGQVSSAYDLALFGRAALANPAIMGYAQTVSTPFPGKMVKKGKRRPTFELWSHQKYVLNYDGALGIKNGWTTLARNTIIAAAERGGRTVIVTLLGAAQGWQEAVQLSDWYFRHGAAAHAVGELVEPGAPAVEAAAPSVAPTLAPAPAPAPAARAQVTGSGSGWLGTVLGVLAVLWATVAGLRLRVLYRRRQRRRRLAQQRVVGPPRRPAPTSAPGPRPARDVAGPRLPVR
ncbi:D-alanyl-D-alanine carboxypeptidase family protein [Motilibacter deserti]|uniref:D-alanyl-D-alanine carboxypeptidase n=1 Tax=Motilibacter deserti TaxID=2714956 RepID=A0ABX0H0I2_9ACTN|nr:D-alanyl-D-alanine carboxypeptidase [Motilibacter deserti]NHC15534.1 D-alanyl-D-alanine carboxypeptidase [Motilibacter deserti]